MKDTELSNLEECLDLIQDAKFTLEMVKDDEEMAYDNLPEGIQMGERGDMMQEAIDTLDEIVYSLDDAISYLEDATSSEVREHFVERSPWDNIKPGDSVVHKSFGSGKIAFIEGKYVTVIFDSKDARFIIPDAFEKGYLTINKK